MRFTCSPRKLHDAAKKVMGMTAVVGNKGNIAVQTIDGGVVVFRNTSECYAEHIVQAVVTEDGKCIAGNLSPLQYIHDDAEFVVDDACIRVGGVVLPLSTWDSDEYVRLQSAGDFVDLPNEAYDTAWVTVFGSGKNETGNTYDKTLFIDGDVVGASVTQSVFSFYKLDEPVFDKSIAIPAEYVLHGYMSLGTNNSIWIRDGDFSCRIQAYDVQSPIKRYYDLVTALPVAASVQVTPIIKNVLQQAAGFNNDYIALAYTGGDSFFVESIETEYGFICERKPAVITGEPFEVVFNAQKLLKTINETPFPRLDIITNTVTMPDGSSDVRYALSAVSGDGKVTNVLMESRISYQFKYKETKND